MAEAGRDVKCPCRILGTFETEDARQAHLNGEIPRALGQVAPGLPAGAPEIRSIDIVAVK